MALLSVQPAYEKMQPEGMVARESKLRVPSAMVQPKAGWMHTLGIASLVAASKKFMARLDVHPTTSYRQL